MKLSTARSTSGYMIAAALATLSAFSCAGGPEPLAADEAVVAAEPIAASDVPALATERLSPEVLTARRPVAYPGAVILPTLPEPALPVPVAPSTSPETIQAASARPDTGSTGPVVDPGIPSDVTVLSTAPSYGTISLAEPEIPEPAPTKEPAPVAPVAAAKPVAPVAASKPAAPKPAVPKPAAPEAAAPEASPVVPAAKATPAPEPTKAPEPEASAEPVEPAYVLPAAPASSARSVAAAAVPVAETRLETARGQGFELRFPGSGWVYLGDEDGMDGIKYNARRFEDSQAVFSLNPERSGEYLLRFHRQNPIDGSTEVSLIRVVVTDKAAMVPASVPATASAASTATVPTAPATSAPATSTPSASSRVSTPTVPAAPAPEAPAPASSALSDPEALLRLARDELDAKRVQSAIEALDRYLSLFPYGGDEAYYLYALACEQDTPFRDIKRSYEYYKRVRDQYPRSPRWKAAAERVAYLERHYFGLR